MASGSVPMVMDTSSGPLTPTRRAAAAATGGSPPAKRPVALVPVHGPSGAAEAGLMDQQQITSAIRELQQKYVNVEAWASIVNDAIGDHAGHIDHQKARVDVLVTHGQTVNAKLDVLTAGANEYAKQAIESDVSLKASIASVVELLGNEVEKLKGHTRDAVQILEVKIDSIGNVTRGGQASSQASDAKIMEVESTMVRRTELLREQGVTVTARIDKLEAMIAAAQQQQQQQQMPQQPPSGPHADPMAGGNDAWSHARAHTHAPHAQHFDIGGHGGGGGGAPTFGNGGHGGGGGGAHGGGGGGASGPWGMGESNMGGRVKLLWISRLRNFLNISIVMRTLRPGIRRFVNT